MSGSALIPVHITPPDEEKRPEWLDKEIDDSRKNPRFEFAGISTADVTSDLCILVKDSAVNDKNMSQSTMRPSQFKWIWKQSFGKFMHWYDLWSICRDAKSNSSEGETAAIEAINRFAEQGGKDIWGNSFDSNFEAATTILIKKVEGDLLYRHGTEYMGDRRYRNHIGANQKSGDPNPPRLSHILAGGGYGLAHLLVAKNLPKALETLLSKQVVTVHLSDEEIEARALKQSIIDSAAIESFSKTVNGAPEEENAINDLPPPPPRTISQMQALLNAPTPVKPIDKDDDDDDDDDDAKTNESVALKQDDDLVKKGVGNEEVEEKVFERMTTSEPVNVDLMSWAKETPLQIARALRKIDCCLVLEKYGANLDPGELLTWLDVWRAIADQRDDIAVQTVARFRRQGCLDELGFGLNYQRMNRIEKDDPKYAFLLKNGRIYNKNKKKDVDGEQGEQEEGEEEEETGSEYNRDGDEGGEDGSVGAGSSHHSKRTGSGSLDEEEEKKRYKAKSLHQSRLALKGHQWWGYADETLGWTLAHMACRKDKPLCLSELAYAGSDLNINATPGLARNKCTPLSIAVDRGFTRCVAVLLNHGVKPEAGGYGVPGGGLHNDVEIYYKSRNEIVEDNQLVGVSGGLYGGDQIAKKGYKKNVWFGGSNRAVEPTSIARNEESWLASRPIDLSSKTSEHLHHDTSQLLLKTQEYNSDKFSGENANQMYARSFQSSREQHQEGCLASYSSTKMIEKQGGKNRMNSRNDSKNVYDDICGDCDEANSVHSIENDPNNVRMDDPWMLNSSGDRGSVNYLAKEHGSKNPKSSQPYQHSSNHAHSSDIKWCEEASHTSYDGNEMRMDDPWLNQSDQAKEWARSNTGDSHASTMVAQDDGENGNFFTQQQDTFNNPKVEESLSHDHYHREDSNSLNMFRNKSHTNDFRANNQDSKSLHYIHPRVPINYPLNYEEVWSALSQEPEDQALRKLKMFMFQSATVSPPGKRSSLLKQHCHDDDRSFLSRETRESGEIDDEDEFEGFEVSKSIQDAIGMQRLDTFGDRCGFTMAHLCADRQYWRCLKLVFKKMFHKHRHLRDVLGRTAVALARERRLLSARCVPSSELQVDAIEKMLQEYSEEHGEESKPVLWQHVYDAIQYSSDDKASQLLEKFINQGCKDANGYGIHHKKNSIHNDTLMSLAIKKRNLVKTMVLLHQVAKQERLKNNTESRQLHDTQKQIDAAKRNAHYHKKEMFDTNKEAKKKDTLMSSTMMTISHTGTNEQNSTRAYEKTQDDASLLVKSCSVDSFPSSSRMISSTSHSVSMPHQQHQYLQQQQHGTFLTTRAMSKLEQLSLNNDGNDYRNQKVNAFKNTANIAKQRKLKTNMSSFTLG